MCVQVCSGAFSGNKREKLLRGSLLIAQLSSKQMLPLTCHQNVMISHKASRRDVVWVMMAGSEEMTQSATVLDPSAAKTGVLLT